MSPLRIVLVLLDPPLPFGKAMGRWYYALLKGLVERGHRVTALTSCATAEEADAARDLFPAREYDLHCHIHPQRHGGLRSKWQTLLRPYSYPFFPEFRRDLEEALADGFDVLHLEVLWSGWCGLAHASRSLLSVPYLFELDWSDRPVGSAGEGLRRLMTYRAEHKLLRSYPRIVAVSPRLRDSIRTIAPRADVRAIPFGMDLSLYPFREPEAASRPPTIGLIASFNWTPGLVAGHRLLERLWPEVKRRVPDARLFLAGVGAREVFRSHVGAADVRIEDRVEDVEAFFRGIDLMLYAPNRSSGMKFKTLESFAFGVPVVTTADGVEGIPAEDGIHAGIAEDDAGLIDRAVALLGDLGARQRLCVAARSLIEATCSPGLVLDQFETIYESIRGRVVESAAR